MTEKEPDSGIRADPWYKVGLMRFFMALFAVLLVATVITIHFAGHDFDGVVATEYVKRNLSIHTSTLKQEKAASMQLKATLWLDWKNERIHMKVIPDLDRKYLRLHIIHPTRESKDQTVLLVRLLDGTYQATIQSLGMKHGYLHLEDLSGQWQLVGEFRPTLYDQNQHETRSWTLTP